MRTPDQNGFTLYELLVGMLVAGVIFGLGIPNLLEFSRNNRMTAMANDMITAITLARNEAIKQRIPVTLCASPQPLLDDPDCDADLSDPDWGGGFIVWVDENGDAVVDAGESLLWQQQDPREVNVIGNSGFITFDIEGYVDDPTTSASAFLLCDERGNAISSGSLSAARSVQIGPLGRARVLREIAEIELLDTPGFGNLACP
jgi:type IV fimbrial biogenesis protein FimT